MGRRAEHLSARGCRVGATDRAVKAGSINDARIGHAGQRQLVEHTDVESVRGTAIAQGDSVDGFLADLERIDIIDLADDEIELWREDLNRQRSAVVGLVRLSRAGADDNRVRHRSFGNLGNWNDPDSHRLLRAVGDGPKVADQLIVARSGDRAGNRHGRAGTITWRCRVKTQTSRQCIGKGDIICRRKARGRHDGRQHVDQLLTSLGACARNRTGFFNAHVGAADHVIGHAGGIVGHIGIGSQRGKCNGRVDLAASAARAHGHRNDRTVNAEFANRQGVRNTLQITRKRAAANELARNAIRDPLGDLNGHVLVFWHTANRGAHNVIEAII